MFHFAFLDKQKYTCFSFFRTTVEQLHNEINALDVRIKKIKKQIDLPSTETEIKVQMTNFLEVNVLYTLLEIRIKLFSIFDYVLYSNLFNKQFFFSWLNVKLLVYSEI